jgi:hypothetical protein
MSLEDRLALHQRIADTYFDAYANHIARGQVVMTDDWKLAPDFVFKSTYHGAEATIAKMIDVAGNTNEMKTYLFEMPDYHAEECLRWPTPEGFVTRTRWVGHTRDGKALVSTLVNFWWVNAAGEITRCESFINGDEIGPVMEKVVGRRGPFESFDEYWAALAARHRREAAARA